MFRGAGIGFRSVVGSVLRHTRVEIISGVNEDRALGGGEGGGGYEELFVLEKERRLSSSSKAESRSSLGE